MWPLKNQYHTDPVVWGNGARQKADNAKEAGGPGKGREAINTALSASQLLDRFTFQGQGAYNGVIVDRIVEAGANSASRKQQRDNNGKPCIVFLLCDKEALTIVGSRDVSVRCHRRRRGKRWSGWVSDGVERDSQTGSQLLFSPWSIAGREHVTRY